MRSSPWSADMVRLIAGNPYPTASVIRAQEVAPLIPGVDLWDLWPVQDERGAVAQVAGGALFMLLSAPALPDPNDRHAVARIRLMHRTGDAWRDLGPLLRDGHAPGSREWAGSAMLAGETLTLHFTAAGTRGEAAVTFRQRLFGTQARLVIEAGTPALVGWTTPVESVAADGAIYLSDMEGGGAIGTIKAFRDPAWFRDPADGAEYLLFTASLAASRSDWNGAIGIARREDGSWTLLPPIITADGVNNELERPHIVLHEGRYHCFWSTQRKVFADGGPAGPNGLYGMVADAIRGPWRPINESGLVLANPDAAPSQAYSWLVLADLSVLSFVDMVGVDRPPSDPAMARAHFGGTPAPALRLRLEGDRSWLA